MMRSRDCAMVQEAAPAPWKRCCPGPGQPNERLTDDQDYTSNLHRAVHGPIPPQVPAGHLPGWGCLMTDRTIAPLFTWRSAVVTSDLTSTQRHVALTLSLYMNERGGSAFPGATRLSEDCGLHVSTVRRALSDLADLGWLQLVSRGGKRGESRKANEYVATRPQPSLPLAQDDGSHRTTPSTGLTDPSHRTTPPLAQDDPSTSLNSSLKTPVGGSRRADLFEALVEVCGLDLDELTKSARGATNRAAMELDDIGASPAGVEARAKVHRQRWPDCEVTPSSLAKNYAQLGVSKSGGGRSVRLCPDCPQSLDDHDEAMCPA